MLSSLRPHQLEARAAIDAHFAAGVGGQRGLIKAFCGSGKSLIMTDSILRHSGSSALVCEPSLSLVSQFAQDYVLPYLAADYEFLVVCSLDDIEDPNTPDEYKTEVTTDPAAITTFLAKKSLKKGKIILCTYQSLDLLSPLGVCFTLACFDEAHVATARTYKKLIFEAAPSLFVKALFFTATPINSNGIYMFNPEGGFDGGGDDGDDSSGGGELSDDSGGGDSSDMEEAASESNYDSDSDGGDSDSSGGDGDSGDGSSSSGYYDDDDGDTEDNEYSAENPHCGPLLFEYSHSRGVAEGFLSDFQIRLDLHCDTEEVSGDDGERDVILFLFQSIVRAMFATGNFHALTFHSRVNGTDTDVSTFTNKKNKALFVKVVRRILRREFPHLEKYKDIHKNIRFEGFSCSTKPAQRQEVLRDLGAAPLDQIFVIASQNTIGVGVDTKNANMVVFIDPKQSYVQIVQNVGRICRKQANGQKTTVLLPLCVSAAQYQEVAGDMVARDRLLRENMTRPDGDFTMILNVLSALRQADPHVFQLCLEYPHTFAPSELEAHFARHNVGLEVAALPVEELFAQHDVVYDPEVSEEDNFTELSHAQKANIQVTHAALTAENMDIYSGYDSVAHYVKTPEDTFVAGKTRTAAFLAKPRRQNVRPFVHCSPEMQVLWGITGNDLEGRELDNLDVFGAYIEATVIVDKDEDWLGKFEQVEAYAKEHGHLPKQHSKDPDEHKMAKWVSHQTQNVKKSSGAIINTNAEFRTKWDKLVADYTTTPEEDWLASFESAETFENAHGHLPTQKIKEGVWIANQKRYVKYPLKHSGAIINKNPDFRAKWDKLAAKYDTTPEEDWLESFESVQVFGETHGHLPKQNSEDADEKKLAIWVGRQTQKVKYPLKYPSGIIHTNTDFRAKWDKLMADHGRDWLVRFEQVEAYAKETGHLPKHGSTDSNEKQMATWVAWVGRQKNQVKYPLKYPGVVINTNADFRAKWDKLMAEYDAHPEEDWLASFESVEVFGKTHGHLPKQNSKDADEKKLAIWLSHQTENVKKRPKAIINTNADFRAKWDKLMADNDRDLFGIFEQIEEYAKTYGHLPQQSSKDLEIKKMATWIANKKRAIILKRPGSLINTNPDIRAKWDKLMAEYATATPTRKRTLSSTASDVVDDDVSEAAAAEPPAEPPAKKQKRPAKKAPLAIAAPVAAVAAAAAPEEMEVYDDVSEAATAEPPAKKQKRSVKKAPLAIAAAAAAAPEEPAAAPAENDRERKRRLLSELSKYHCEFNGKASARTQAHFQANPDDWRHYHDLLHASYDTYENPQAAVPVLRLIGQFEKKRSTAQKKVVVDLGCGLAEIGRHFRDSDQFDVISIDYVAADPALPDLVRVGNMRDTRLPDGCANYVVFCLSLMGNAEDVEAYLAEARRILDAQGEVIVVEPRDSGRWMGEGEGGEACGELRALLEDHFVISKTKGHDERFLYFYCRHKEDDDTF